MLALILKLRSFSIKIFTENKRKWFLIQYTEKVTHSVKFLTHTHTHTHTHKIQNIFQIYFLRSHLSKVSLSFWLRAVRQATSLYLTKHSMLIFCLTKSTRRRITTISLSRINRPSDFQSIHWSWKLTKWCLYLDILVSIKNSYIQV